jgi:phage gp46-like protein
MDLALTGENLPYDLTMENGDFVADYSLKNAVVISLFCDQRVNSDELPEGETSRRGWFGDMLADSEGDAIGSRLWLLAREKVTDETATRARGYAEESLAWMIEDGIADTVKVEAETDGSALLLSVEISKGGKVTSFQFNLTEGV